MRDHNANVVDQFSQQAIPFSNAPALRDRAALAQLVALSGACPNDRVLDVACGPGLVMDAFAPNVHHMTGVDLTPAMIERAREQTRKHTNVTLQLSDVCALPFPDSSFEIVVSRLAFHHFVEPARVLAQMQRVCTPGGKVVIYDLLASDDPDKAQAFHQLEIVRDASHARALTRLELEHLLDAAQLSRRPTVFAELPFELESLLSRSFPAHATRAQLREVYLQAIDDDGLGLKLRRNAEGVEGAYTTGIFVADKR